MSPQVVSTALNVAISANASRQAYRVKQTLVWQITTGLITYTHNNTKLVIGKLWARLASTINSNV